LLELGATERATRSLRLDLSSSCRGRWYARIITGLKSIIKNTLTGRVTKTVRKRRLLAGRNWTSVDASLHSRR